MKLSKTSWLLLTIGIFVVLFASLGMAYSQQDKEQSRLNQELSSVQLLLTKQLSKFSPEKFSSQQKELESRLAQAGPQLETARTNLSQSIESIEVTDTLFEIAQACEVEIIEIRSSGLTSKELEGVTCSVLSLTAQVEGDVPNLINFILEVSREFPTVVVKSVGIVIPEVTDEEVEAEEVEAEEEETEGEGEGEEESEKPSANIVLSIHTYTGD